MASNDIYRSPSYEGFKIAQVIRTDDPEKSGRVGVHMQELMFQITDSDKLDFIEKTEKPINKNRLLNENVEVSNVANSNFLWVRPLYLLESNDGELIGNYKVPRLFSHVIVIFIDGDPKKGYYLPYTASLTNEVAGGKLIYRRADHWEDAIKKPNIEVFREYYNGMIIEVDPYNEDGIGNHYRIRFAEGYEHCIEHNEEKKEIRYVTPNGKTFKIDEFEGRNHISVKSDTGAEMKIDDELKKMTLVTEKGNKIEMHDGNQIEITSISGSKVTIDEQGRIFIESKTDMSITSNGNMNITSKGILKVKARSIDVDAGSTFKFKSSISNVEASVRNIKCEMSKHSGLVKAKNI